MSTVLGPVLQFRGIRQKAWQISALVVVNTGEKVTITPHPSLKMLNTYCIAKIPFDAPRYDVYRMDFALEAHETQGMLILDGKEYTFQAPLTADNPRVAFVSCNGFSDPKLMKSVNDKNDRWKDLAFFHAQQPYHILVMGGDQIYTDEMWNRIKALHAWTDLPLEQRLTAPFTDQMHKELDELLCSIYLTRWTQPEVLAMLSSIPTIMMWDDHDIFDGWGSYSEELHFSPVYQGIFKLAKRYFHTFQMQLNEKEVHPCALPGQSTYNMGFSSLGSIGILALDLRSERRPALRKIGSNLPSQIVSPESWESIYKWVDSQKKLKHLLVISSIPVAYLNLNVLERILSVVPGQQELEDDLRDHWRSTTNSQERLRLIHRLLKFSGDQKTRVTILSGDVHVAAAAVIESTRDCASKNACVINQLVSSGVVHPAPPSMVRYVLESIADKEEHVDRGITSNLQQLNTRGTRLIGARNWLAIEPDGSNNLWANWHVEGEIEPLTKVIHPV